MISLNRSYLIVNAVVVNEGQLSPLDVYIKDGRIARLGPNLQSQSADVVIDAMGKSLLPGMIDDQVHFREPGFPDKADIFSESRAAVAGGVTSFMEMPNTLPPTTTRKRLEEKYALAARNSMANYSFYLGATAENLKEIRSLRQGEACGVKIFLGSTTGDLLLEDPRVISQVFQESPLLIAAHCECPRIIRQNEEAMRVKMGENIPPQKHAQIRSHEACLESTQTALALARETGARLHVLHLSTAAEVDLFASGPVSGKRLTCEACTHHLWFDDSAYAKWENLVKCNPSIKSAKDRAALRQGLIDDRIDVIASDHAPHTLAEKRQPYFQAPSGIPLVQYNLCILLELYHDNILTLERIVTKTSHAVADLFGIVDRGYIREGYWADLVLVDLNRKWTVERESILSKCGWSPLEGKTFRSSINTTFVSGQMAYRAGWLDARVRGMRMAFHPANA